MPSSIQKFAFLLGAAIAITVSGLACLLDRSGLLIPPVPSLSAEPSPSCPGEPVTITWDLNLPAGPEWCFCLNGSLRADPIPCAFTSECPGSEICLDGFCCNRELCGNECGNPTDACPADFRAHLDIAGSGSEITAETGSTTVSPISDTPVTISGAAIAGSTEQPWPDRTIMLDVIAPGSTRPFPLIFPWICPTTTWEDIEVAPRSFLRILGVTNTSPYRVRVSVKKTDYTGPPVELNLGETTFAFNGMFEGEWGIEVIDPLVLVVPPDCLSDVTDSDRLPNLTLELTIDCITP